MLVKVNPGKTKEGEYLKVEDRLGRLIKYKSEGNLIKKDTYISRAIKRGDLVICEEIYTPKKKEKEA